MITDMLRAIGPHPSVSLYTLLLKENTSIHELELLADIFLRTAGATWLL